MDNIGKVIKSFKAKTLEDAYEKAASYFKCSITQLDIIIKQTNSNGFLGFFSKNAIIEVISISTTSIKNKQNNTTKITQIIKDTKNINNSTKNHQKANKIFNNFYDKNSITETNNAIKLKNDNMKIIDEIKIEINQLFSTLCYTLDEINVYFYDENTICIEFQGDDAALLIGKEGYRYKALSYILFNWIHNVYNYMLRLEVAQFLVAQEEAVHNYLIPIIQTIKDNNFYKTKPLDGVLVHIALKKLRYEFPEKYVAVKTNIKGEKYILVNEYKK
jgi:spoIIIJ-associated protein